MVKIGLYFREIGLVCGVVDRRAQLLRMSWKIWHGCLERLRVSRNRVRQFQLSECLFIASAPPARSLADFISPFSLKCVLSKLTAISRTAAPMAFRKNSNNCAHFLLLERWTQSVSQSFQRRFGGCFHTWKVNQRKRSFILLVIVLETVKLICVHVKLHYQIHQSIQLLNRCFCSTQL